MEEYIRKLLRDSPTGLLFDSHGAPVFVDDDGHPFWMDGGRVPNRVDLHSLPPHLRRAEVAEKEVELRKIDELRKTVAQKCWSIAELEAKVRAREKTVKAQGEEIGRLADLLSSARTEISVLEGTVKGLRKIVDETKPLQQQKLKLKLCSKPPNNGRNVLIWEKGELLGKAHYCSLNRVWFSHFPTRQNWFEYCSWSELPEVE